MAERSIGEKAWTKRPCTDGLVHYVTLELLRAHEPRKWLRYCDKNDDGISVTALPSPEAVMTCIVCMAHEERVQHIESLW